MGQINSRTPAIEYSLISNKILTKNNTFIKYLVGITDFIQRLRCHFKRSIHGVKIIDNIKILESM